MMIINFDPTLTNPVVRGLGWNVKRSQQFRNLKHTGDNGKSTVVPRYTSPLWQWELKWNYVRDNWPFPIQIQTQNAPFTDLEILEGVYGQVLGGGGLFLYQPPYYNVQSQVLSYPDANDNTEVVYTYGAQPYSVSGGTLSVTNIAINNNFLTATVSGLGGLAVGDGVNFAGLTGASFLNGQGMYVAGLDIGSVSNTFGGPYIHANYGPTSDSGTATINNGFNLTNESVQYMTGLNVFVNGAGTSAFTLAQPSSVSPYMGYVLQWTSVPAAGSVITASFDLFYNCLFADDDVLSPEEFMANLWSLQSLKFMQNRI
jgi:hypothetical protein